MSDVYFHHPLTPLPLLHSCPKCQGISHVAGTEAINYKVSMPSHKVIGQVVVGFVSCKSPLCTYTARSEPVLDEDGEPVVYGARVNIHKVHEMIERACHIWNGAYRGKKSP